MTRVRNVGGKIVETTGGNDTSYAEKDIVFNSLKPINFTGEESGVTFNKPKKYQPKTDLKITKVEGPFDDNDKLVKVVKKGVFYTYKATPSRKPDEAEIKLLKWAVKNDDKGKIIDVTGVASYNQLVKDKITIRVAINADCEKARIYAYYKKATDSMSVLTDVE